MLEVGGEAGERLEGGHGSSGQHEKAPGGCQGRDKGMVTWTWDWRLVADQALVDGGVGWFGLSWSIRSERLL